MQGQRHVCALSGSLVLLLVTLLIACSSAAAQTSAAPPTTSEGPDAGLLRAQEASPKRGGVLRWGGVPRPGHHLVNERDVEGRSRRGGGEHGEQHGNPQPHDSDPSRNGEHAPARARPSIRSREGTAAAIDGTLREGLTHWAHRRGSTCRDAPSPSTKKRRLGQGPSLPGPRRSRGSQSARLTAPRPGSGCRA